MSDRVCVIVVTHNRMALLRACLDGVLGQLRPSDAILVVDIASSDGTAEYLAGRRPGILTLRCPTNIGGAGGFAAGIEWARARDFDWLWLMDDDVIPERGCLAELLAVSAESGRRVAVPRRLAVDGRDCFNEAVLVERAQRFERVSADPLRARYQLIDLFTFEGPLIHRSVVDAVGLPEPHLFIRGDDISYAVRINRRCGRLSCALAARATMQKQLPPEEQVVVRSRIKAWVTGSAHYAMLFDADHWKTAYTLRNLHLIYRELAWRRRSSRLLIAHVGYIGVDLLLAVRHRWNWPLRLKWNVVACGLGMVGNRTRFLDPAVYQAQLDSGRHARKGPPQ